MEKLFDCIIGINRNDAQNFVESIMYNKEFYYKMRVVMIDRNPVIITHDFRVDRLNVEVQDGKISKIHGIG